VFEAFYLLNTRFLIEPAWLPRVLFGNRWVPVAIALVMGFQMLYTYAPFMQAMFQSAPLAAGTWLNIVLVASSVYVIVEIEKGIVRILGLRVT